MSVITEIQKFGFKHISQEEYMSLREIPTDCMANICEFMDRKFVVYKDVYFLYKNAGASGMDLLMSFIRNQTMCYIEHENYKCFNNAVVKHIYNTYYSSFADTTYLEDTHTRDETCKIVIEQIIVPLYYNELQLLKPIYDDSNVTKIGGDVDTTVQGAGQLGSNRKKTVAKPKKYANSVPTSDAKANTVPVKSTPKKKSIPLTLKRNVWNKHIGESIGKTLCTCCKLTEITQLNFSCGHIVSEHNGGELKLPNLKPICVSCNSSMGTKNMDEFICEYGL